MPQSRLLKLAAAGAVVALAVAGCSSSGGSSSTSSGGFTPPDIQAQTELGEPEGEVNVLAWPGYAEDGSTDPSVDWVSGFEEETGCQVNIKTFGTSDEAIQLFKTGEYDTVSASGDASLRLIAAGEVAPVNFDLIPNYADIFPDLKMQPWNSVNGVGYGPPHGRGANILMYNTEKVTPAPDSWGVVFDGGSAYSGAVTAYDSPIYIADAALYLMATQPDLGITDPYALDEAQLAAAVELLKAQKANVGEYWSDYLKEISSFKSGDTVVGTSWQVILNIAAGEGVTVEGTKPKEGATGWSDTWMIGAKAKNPNCAYLWMNHIISPEANAGVAEWFGEAPANAKSCDLTADEDHCATYHADDAAYWTDVYYWNTPIPQCLDGRTDVTCTDYAQWTQAWTEIKG